ncbi:oxidoreductase (Fe-S)-binding subunit [Mixta theicola]|uniref:Oxidoreductase (Fe-S)-binding subunit n=1 Tax=Mixta theicola TaxID=1458355 RepID=A0A2K1QCG4_9GAMM|nr:FAD-dependent oxidoreductase [Mixta theicola]PNS12724.1 oxidoreductase (Fe-S)-binding subunit [Mixta theicola]GLR10305.1 oxidoreductase Fe-S-binding subunit [Mixta theicola]
MNKFIVTDPQECIGCHVCEVACVVAHNNHLWPEERSAFIPRIQVIFQEKSSVAVTCRHCNDAPCVESCPVDALHFGERSIQLDEQRCIGCKNCLVACPFGAIEMVSRQDPAVAIAQKCDLCSHQASPACVASCPTQALQLLDDAALEALRHQRQRTAAAGVYQKNAAPGLAARLLDKPERQGAIKIAAAQRKTHFQEIYQGLEADRAGNESRRCLYCAQKAWCNWACPLHNAIPDFIRLVNQGHILEAAELCHQTSTLPEICGRVCPQDRLCEGACTLKSRNGAVTIGNLERYITDTAFEMGWRPAIGAMTPRTEKVAIIGAGPAGLGCADILARAGIQADVFDRHPEIGGLLTFGIPPFKLDKQLMARRRDIFSAMGIRFHLNCEIGRDVHFSELMAKYDAIFLGTGTYGLLQAGLAHEDAPGVVQALPFLIASTRRVMELEEDPRNPWVNVKGKNVVVLGGGDTAMDCLRTAIRREAASVTCAYRRDEASMPGSKKEVINAREEGVEFLFNVQPQQIQRDRKGRVNGIKLIRTVPGEPGPDGRRKPQPVKGSEFVQPADVLIMALGFRPHAMPWLDQYDIKLDNWGLIKTGGGERLATQTSQRKVFAGGDAVHGADLVVTAMVAGRQAARDILTMLEHQPAQLKAMQEAL